MNIEKSSTREEEIPTEHNKMEQTPLIKYEVGPK